MAQSPAAEPGAGQSLEGAHKALLERDDLQFVFEPPKVREVRETPNWLRDFFEGLGSLLNIPAQAVNVMFWVLVAVAVVAVLYLIAREVGALDFTIKRPKPAPADPLYRPDAETARTLLADADALAAQGLYEEAVHVLLLRSVDDVRRWRPGTVEPSFTSRDLAVLPVLPGPARTAFSAMARLVETSLFGGRPVGREGFDESRRAYAEFALPGVWAGAAS